jgi:outer membrane biosynthesis protein TonB
VSSRRPDIDPELDAIVAGALARDPEARFPTAAKMANALTSFLTRRGLAVRAGDVVSLLQSLFPGAREESRRRVDNWLEGQRDASTPQLLGLTEVGARISTSAIRPIPGRPPPGRALLGLGLFAIVAVLGATGFLLGRRTGHAPIPAPAPSAVAAARDDAVGTEAFHLALNSSPVESTIEWSGKPLGQTPLMVDLDPGPQVFVLKREGFHPATVVVTVTERMKGTTESRTVMMVPDDKDLSHPASAQSAPQAKVITTTGAAPALRRVSLAAAGSAENPYSAVAPSAQADTPTAAPAPSPASDTTPAAAPAPAADAPGPAIAAAAPALTPALAATAAPSASAAAGAVMHYGPDMSKPVLLSSVDPVYPREALVAGVEGIVIAKCTITTSGSLESCHIIRGLPFMDKPILDALSQRKYTPVLYKGSPVAVQYVFNTRIVRP